MTIYAGEVYLASHKYGGDPAELYFIGHNNNPGASIPVYKDCPVVNKLTSPNGKSVDALYVLPGPGIIMKSCLNCLFAAKCRGYQKSMQGATGINTPEEFQSLHYRIINQD